MLGLAPGATVDASDTRVEAARYRLLSLGYFLDVHLSVTRGSRRGSVVLVVEVEERGTLVINELFPATSEATLFWGGADVSETNFLGRGINLGAGFVASTKPLVPYAHAGLGLRLHVGVPPLGGPNGLGLAVTGLYNDGSEFYRTSGADSDADPGRFVATRVRRIGGVLTVGKMFPTTCTPRVGFREESVSATLPPPALQTQTFPDGSEAPIDFMIHGGSSRVGTVGAGLDYDTRSDPVLPRSGMRLALSVEAGTSLLGSQLQLRQGGPRRVFYLKMPRGPRSGFTSSRAPSAATRPTSIASSSAISICCCRGGRWGSTSRPSPRRTSSAPRSPASATTTTPAACWSSTRSRSGATAGLVYGGDAFVAVGLLGMASDEEIAPVAARSI